jgi:hypothetical protein
MLTSSAVVGAPKRALRVGLTLQECPQPMLSTALRAGALSLGSVVALGSEDRVPTQPMRASDSTLDTEVVAVVVVDSLGEQEVVAQLMARSRVQEHLQDFLRVQHLVEVEDPAL